MNRPPFRAAWVVGALSVSFLIAGESTAENDWSGFLALDSRFFPTSSLFQEQTSGDVSVAFQPEYYRDWDSGTQSLTVTPFVRIDTHDPERTHFDLRELSWQISRDRWELRAGIRKEFWGVVESYHLVDVINQTDLVENIDGEQKLGQPMVNFAWIDSWGTLDFYLLTGFRERTFPSKRGRLRSPLDIDRSRTSFESSRGKSHIDWALRWSHSLWQWDLGVAHFSGTSREPLLLPAQDLSGAPVLVPFYEQVDRTSLDLQMTQGSWLFKLEAVRQTSKADTFAAGIGGVEYTFYGLFDSRVDLGILVEYLYSGHEASSLNPFEDDVFVAARLSLNDTQSTNLLAGVTLDRKTGAGFVNLEAQRRIGESWKLILQMRAFVDVPERDRLFWIRADDYFELNLAWFF